MRMKLRGAHAAAVVSIVLAGCSEPDGPGSVGIKIADREDFTYSAGYSNGCRYTIQVINNTDLPLAKLEVFLMRDDTFMFSISETLPPRGASTRTHDVQQNLRCNELKGVIDLQKNACSLGDLNQAACFDIVAIVPEGS